MKRNKLSTENYLRRKGAPESGVDLSSVFKDINGLRNGIKGIVTTGQDPTQLNFQLVRQNGKKI